MLGHAGILWVIFFILFKGIYFSASLYCFFELLHDLFILLQIFLFTDLQNLLNSPRVLFIDL